MSVSVRAYGYCNGSPVFIPVRLGINSYTAIGVNSYLFIGGGRKLSLIRNLYWDELSSFPTIFDSLLYVRRPHFKHIKKGTIVELFE